MKLYPLMMKTVVLPAAGLFTDVSIWEQFRSMMKTEKLSSDELESLQLMKLKKMLRHAYEHVPFYRMRFDEIGFRPEEMKSTEDICQIPPTTKDDIMRHFPEEITAQGMDKSKWKYVATSGTTRQIMGIHDFRKANLNWAAGLRAHKLAGNHDVGKKWMEIPPHMCTNICGANDDQQAGNFFTRELFSMLFQGDIGAMKQHFYQYAHARRQSLYRRVTIPSFGSEGTNIPEKEIAGYIDTVRKYEPHLLEGLPLYLYTFAKYIIRKEIEPPRVGVIKPFGGSLTEHMKETIRTAFRCRVYDTYGCSETGFIACECDRHDGLHVFSDLYYVEVCSDGKPAGLGELGRLYITDLENSAMPWIRYDIGDVGRCYPDDHGCGRASMRIRVEGRVQDTLRNSAGKFFTSDQVFDFFHSRAEIDNFQLIEKTAGRFELLCVPREGAMIDKEEISREFRQFFDSEAIVKVFIAKTIKAEDGGKFRFIKSKGLARI